MSNSVSYQHDQALTRGLVDQAFGAVGGARLLQELRARPSDCFLVGGAVRDALLGVACPADLDLIVPNGDSFVHSVLGRRGVPRRNRHGNWRYTFASGQHVDVIEPRYFYCQFESPVEALRFFDTSVNSVGVRLHDGHVLNPRDGLQDLLAGQVTLFEERWTTMNDFESVHLTLRLLRLIEKHPLDITNPSLAAAHIEKFDAVDWDELSRLNGVSCNQAQAVARATFGRQASLACP